MRDAFGVERGDDVSKAFSLRPVKDFVAGATNALRGGKGGAANYTQAGAKGGQMAGQAKQAFGAVKTGVKTGAATGFGAAKAKMPSVPKPSKRTVGTVAGIGGAGAVAGGVGYAAGKPDWQR